MLRLLVLTLLLVNAGYFAWSQNLLADYGFSQLVQAEPQRLLQQIHPEALQLIQSDEHPQSPVAANAGHSAATQCLQAGLFSDEQANALRPSLQASLPPGSWTLESGVEPGRWIIYMGRYISDEALARKRNELRQRNIPFEQLQNAAWSPGLSLGHFNSQAEAQKAMTDIAQRGVRTARVREERAEQSGHILKLASVDAALLEKLDPLKALLADKALRACL
ncbi:hypothetical protein AwPolaro_11180 [Polaromonas sp.]|nr:hypothetical protein AwPolaro_11180 [Polaromonas sp.]